MGDRRRVRCALWPSSLSGETTRSVHILATPNVGVAVVSTGSERNLRARDHEPFSKRGALCACGQSLSFNVAENGDPPYQMRVGWHSMVSGASKSSVGVVDSRNTITPVCSGVGTSPSPRRPASGPRHRSQPRRS